MLVVDALATYRLTRLVTTDRITASARARIGGLHPTLAYLVSCNYCTSVYAAAVVPFLPPRVRYMLALASTSLIYEDIRAAVL